jgi:hypothetical protein
MNMARVKDKQKEIARINKDLKKLKLLFLKSVNQKHWKKLS